VDNVHHKNKEGAIFLSMLKNGGVSEANMPPVPQKSSISDGAQEYIVFLTY